MKNIIEQIKSIKQGDYAINVEGEKNTTILVHIYNDDGDDRMGFTTPLQISINRAFVSDDEFDMVFCHELGHWLNNGYYMDECGEELSEYGEEYIANKVSEQITNDCRLQQHLDYDLENADEEEYILNDDATDRMNLYYDLTFQLAM